MRDLRIKALNWRNNLLASERFRSFAAAFWPTRFIARRRASEVFDIVAGFTYSQTLFACVELELFSALRDGPVSRQELNDLLELDAGGVRALLDAAQALRLLECPAPDLYGLGPLGAAIVDDDAIKSMVRHHAHFYRDLADPLALLASRDGTTDLSGYWPYADKTRDAPMPTDAVATYTQLMSASQPMICEQVHAAYDLSQHRHLMDVGGGSGAFLASVAVQAPELALSLFDMAPVTELANEFLSERGVRDKVTIHAGDFTQNVLPAEADIISLVRILHDHDDAVVEALLANVFAALPPGGRVLIAEPLANTAGSPRMGSVYFSFYLRAMGSGRPRRLSELKNLLHRAGFVAAQQKKTRIPMLASVIVAEKPLDT